MKKYPALIAIVASFFFIMQGLCQNTLQFTGVNATPEKSIILHWASNTNEYYEIDYADSLVDTNSGSTTWTQLYDDYPSQGTNTLWQDAGNFDITPNVSKPKDSPMRFYRVSLEGTNTLNDNLLVAITSLTNGSVVSGNVIVTVAASSSYFLSRVTLYLDGKEMPRSIDGSNFVFNSCETWNGSHTLFAVAKSQTGLEGFRLDSPITYDRAVSTNVNITIENLITDFAFSQDFFQPSLGQTQAVTANFTANCNWALQILDSSSNAVRTVTGSGNSMAFNWDGTGDGGTNIPDAIYTYFLSAATNALPLVIQGGSPSATSNVKTLWALEPGSETPVPFAIYPIGYDTNGMTIFKATQSEIDDLIGDTNSTSVTPSGGGFFTPDDSGGAGSSQNTSDSGPKNAQGTIGICYQRYLTDIPTHNPTSGININGLQFVAIDGVPATPNFIHLPEILATKILAKDFANGMKATGYITTFNLGDDDFTINDLRKTSEGGNSILNTVNLGMFLGHGSFGTTAESDGVKYTYTWIESLKNSNIQYLRLSDFDFGGTQPNGLRWMTMVNCSPLNQTCYNSMNSHSKLPINSNLHLLLGSSTNIYFVNDLGANYAMYLARGDAIIDAWVNAGRYTYSYEVSTNMTGQVINFAHAGWTSCLSDTITNFFTPSGSITYGTDKVYPYP